MLTGLIILLITGFTTTIFADEPESSGFSARLDAGGAWMSTQSHLEVGDDNKRLAA